VNAFTVGAGQAVVDVDPLGLDPEAQQGVAVGGIGVFVDRWSGPVRDRPVGRFARRLAGGNGPGKRATLAFAPSVGLAEFGA
jgi:hypothetical protein